MYKIWKGLMIVGYILLGLFGINLIYVLVIYAIRHENWFLIYNPNFGPHTNPELAWQIIWSIVLSLIAWTVVTLSKRRLKAKTSPQHLC